MILNVFERLLLRNIVPQIKGWNFGYMKEARELMESLFSPEEEEILCITQDGERVEWKTADDSGNPLEQEKDLGISDGLKEKIARFLTKLDKEEALNFEHYSLFEKFVDKRDTGE